MRGVVEEIVSLVKENLGNRILRDSNYVHSGIYFMSRNNPNNTQLIKDFTISKSKLKNNLYFVSLNPKKLENFMLENLESLHVHLEFGSLVEDITTTWIGYSREIFQANFKDSTLTFRIESGNKINFIRKRGNPKKEFLEKLYIANVNDLLALSLVAQTKQLTNENKKIELLAGNYSIEFSNKIKYSIRRFYIAHTKNLMRFL